jgi:fatty-acyl-CoA synthase
MPLTESHAIGATDVPLLEETIGSHFEAMARRFPQREALVSRHQGQRFTYAELDQEANRLASALLRAGLTSGDRAGIWAHNGAEWLLMQLATAKVGIVLVNINPAYRVTELEYALNKVGCKMLVTMTAFKTSDYLAIVRDLAPELATSQAGQLNAARAPALRTVVQLGAGREPGMLSFAELLASGGPDDPAVPQAGARLKATDPINIQFTSGTTGFPKGATLTHRNILNNGFFIGEAMKLTEADRLCVPVPLYHCFGMVLGNLACLTHGAAIVYPNDGFDPLTVLETVQAEKCTGLHGVPTMFIAELAHSRFAEFDLSTLRTGIMAGSPCPIEVMKQVVGQMHMAEVTIAYGMTETSPVSCQSSTETPLDKRVATVGQVQPHLQIKVIDPETGRTVPVGTTGELCTKGYSVMHGYWGDEEDPRGDRQRALDAHRRPGHDGRRGLRQHRRAHQGHGHPRRRERVPARDRGVPLPPPGRLRRAGDRRAGQEIRRGAVRLDHPEGRPARHRRRGARLLQRQDRALQGAALHQVRRRFPDDHHRQDPEVRHARSDEAGAEPVGRQDRLTETLRR